MKYIELTQGYRAIVDDEDFEELNKYKWRVNKHKDRRTFYAVSYLGIVNGKKKEVRMHHLILNPPEGMMIDHINGKGFDNRKENIRIVTKNQNSLNRIKPKNNTSGYKGVHWHKEEKKWVANIQVDNKRFHLGSFVSKITARDAYLEASKKYHGEFRRK